MIVVDFYLGASFRGDVEEIDGIWQRPIVQSKVKEDDLSQERLGAKALRAHAPFPRFSLALECSRLNDAVIW